MSAPKNTIEALFSDQMFQFTWFLDANFIKSLEPLVSAAMIIGGLLWALQIAKDIYDGALSGGNWKEKIFYSFIKLGIIAAIITTPFYTDVLMKGVIGGIPQTIASGLADDFIGKFFVHQADLFASYGNSGKIGGFLSAAFSSSGVIQIIASFGFFFMNAISMVLPMVQKSLFELCAYLGPFAFVFLLCDWTKEIFTRWLSMSLAVSWLSVTNAITMHIYVHNFMESARLGADVGDVFSVAIDTIVACGIMMSAPMITMFLFNAAGSGMDKAGGWGAISAAASAGAKVALPASGAAVGGIKSVGYNQDGTKKAGAGAAIARAAHSVGNMVVQGSAKPGSVSSEAAKSLAHGGIDIKKGAASNSGDSRLGASSVPSGGASSSKASASPTSNTSGGSSGDNGSKSSIPSKT